MNVVSIDRVPGVEGRLPAHDMDAEAAVLTACIEHPEVAAKAFEIVDFDDFYSGMHRSIAKVIASLLSDNVETNKANVYLRLSETGHLSDVGGKAGLEGLLESGGSVSALIVRYASRVRDLAYVRRLCLALQRATAECYRPVEDVAAFTAKIQSDLDVATFRRGADGISSALESSKELARELGTPKERVITTGIASLDRFVRGFERDMLYILAGRTSMGKSALGIQMAAAASEQGARVLVISMEMTRVALIRRIACARSNVAVQAVRDKSLTPAQCSRLTYALSEVSRWPLFMSKGDSMTLSEIRASVHKHKPDLLVVDHIGLLTPPEGSSKSSREQVVAGFSRGLKNLAMSSRISVMTLCQIGRASAKEGKRPAMTDLRESGSIEQDADGVWMIHRPGYYEHSPSPEALSVAELNVAKQRDGMTGTIALRWTPEQAMFSDAGCDQ